MKHGSLFSGIGGFDLAAEWMGWENVFQVEIDPFCQKVLAKNFPNVKRYGDIKEFKGERGSADIISGGVPCQPASTAGKRKGESDDRWLWNEFIRVVREIQPAHVVCENVFGLVSLDNGKALDGILLGLEAEGYVTEQFIIPACGVGAWHRRDRIWIIAYNEMQQRSGGPVEKKCKRTQFKNRGLCINVPDTEPKRLQGKSERQMEESGEPTAYYSGDGSTRQRRLRERESGTWSTEPDVGRVVARLPFTLDETLNDYGYASNKEAFTEIDKFRESIMRDMWSKERKIKQTPYGTKRGQGYDSMHPMSHGYSHERWKLGQRIEENKDLRDLWNRIYTKPFKETQDLQQKMLERIREIERNEKVASSRINRLKGLGNAIVPQVAYEIFKAIHIHSKQK